MMLAKIELRYQASNLIWREWRLSRKRTGDGMGWYEFWLFVFFPGVEQCDDVRADPTSGGFTTCSARRVRLPWQYVNPFSIFHDRTYL